MPIEITRFDAQYATPVAWEGASGVREVLIADSGGTRLTTLYFETRGELGKREVPHDVLLMILNGSGTVRLGGEIREVTAGEAIPFPANNLHMVWTTDAPMTALTVEYSET